MWVKGLNMTNSIETSKNTNAQNISTTVSGVEVLGKTFDEFGNSLFVAKAHGANDYEAFTFDPVNLISPELFKSRLLADVIANAPDDFRSIFPVLDILTAASELKLILPHADRNAAPTAAT